MIRVTVRQLPHAEGLPLPAYRTAGAAGLDLAAAIPEALTIPAGNTHLIPTGLQMAIPEGFEAQIRSRSGLALKSCVVVFNSPGTLDSDYRGEIKVLLANWGKQPFTVNRGDRIGQLVFAPVARAELAPGDLDATERGAGGFGSTGTAAP
jgi:dUTP pyrophosphatase